MAASPAQSPLEAYQSCMSLIAERLRLLRGYPNTGSYLDAEITALHVRKIVESVAFAGLSALERGSASRLDGWRTRDADKLLALMKAKGLLHLPEARDVTPGQPGTPYRMVVAPAPSRDLSCEELQAAYREASSVVHERHPERMDDDLIAQMNVRMTSTARRLDGWLWSHTTFFVGKDGRPNAFLIQMGLFGTPSFFAEITKQDEPSREVPTESLHQ